MPQLVERLGAGVFRWPSQASARLFYGAPGSNLTQIVPPFTMTYEGKPIHAITVNKRCAASLDSVLQNVWNALGRDQSKIDEHGISKFSGSYNFRHIRGSRLLSMHAFGAALDFDAEFNPMTGDVHAKHVFTDDHPLVMAFKAEGWRWGGDYHGRKDFMHFEACR